MSATDGLFPAVRCMVGRAAREFELRQTASLLHDLPGLNVNAKTVERRAEGSAARPPRTNGNGAWLYPPPRAR